MHLLLVQRNFAVENAVCERAWRASRYLSSEALACARSAAEFEFDQRIAWLRPYAPTIATADRKPHHSL